MIRLSPVRVIGPDDEQIGVLETHEAIRLAQQHGLDLVEVVADQRPPICKIMDFGQYRYEETKKEQRSRASSRSAEMKEIRLGRSTKIDPHDQQIRIEQARRFLMDGHKVRVVQRFRGREMAHKDLGIQNLRRFCDDLSDISKVELEPRWVGRQTSIVLAPDRPRIESIKRKREAARLKESQGETPADGTTPTTPEPIAPDAEPTQEDLRIEAKRADDDRRQKNPVDAELDALLGE